MDYSHWIIVSDHLPPRHEDSNRSDWVAVVVGLTRQKLAIAAYDHDAQQWVDEAGSFRYGYHTEMLVTHWLPLPALPARVADREVGAVESDFITADTVMRALFNSVGPDEKQLHATITRTVSFTGMQGTRIQTCGALKGNRYYVDFCVHDPLELRTLKANLDALNLPYVITDRRK